MNICISGDSITKGFYDDEKGGWVNRLKEARQEDKIFNLGISGDTINELLERFEKDVSGKNPNMIIFSIGINDSIYIMKEDRNFVSFDEFIKNIRKLAEKARKFCEKIVFVGLVPVDESLVAPMPWEPELYYLNKEIEKYDEAIREICKEEEVKLIDINQEMKKTDYKEMLSDGIHPNAKGHQWLAEKIGEQI